jgi:hypothetical protein
MTSRRPRPPRREKRGGPPLAVIYLSPYTSEQPPLHRWGTGLSDDDCSASIKPPRRKPGRGEAECPVVSTEKPPKKPTRTCDDYEYTNNECPRFLASTPASACMPPKKPKRTSDPAACDVNPCIDIIKNVSLKPIHLDTDTSGGIVSENVEKSENAKSLHDLVNLQQQQPSKESGGNARNQHAQNQQDTSSRKNVSIVFCIRRAGCGNCREHGLQLSELAAKEHDVNLMGAIKQTEHDAALLDFYHDYFTFPIYVDRNWSLYQQVLGNRKVRTWELLSNVVRLGGRYKQNQVHNQPFGGDLFTKGGGTFCLFVVALFVLVTKSRRKSFFFLPRTNGNPSLQKKQAFLKKTLLTTTH